MPKKPKLPAYRHELPCVILAIDPGGTSGWAILVEGKPKCWGALLASDSDGIDRVIFEACDLAIRYKLPLVVLGEEWGRGGKRGMAQWQGLGGAWMAWKYGCDRARAKGLPVVESRVLRVLQRTWRSVFGLNLGREVVKAYCLRAARERTGIELPAEQHDVAEALLIGLWGARAAAVGAKLPKRLMATWATERAEVAYG